MNEYEERLHAMAEDTKSLTWDFSANDTAAIRWAMSRISELEAQLATAKPSADAAAVFTRLAAEFARDVSDTPGLTEREAWIVKKLAELEARKP